MNDIPNKPFSLRRRFVIAFVVASIVGVIGFAASYLIPKTYESDTSLLFPQDQTGAPQSGLASILRGKASSEGGSVTSPASGLSTPLVGSGPNTAIAILQSRETLDQIVARASLTSEWAMASIPARDKLRGNLIAEIDRSGLLKVTYFDHDPALATNVLNVALKLLEERSNDLSINVGKQNRVFAEKRLAVAELRVKHLLTKLPLHMNPTTLGEANLEAQAYLDAKKALNIEQVKVASAQGAYSSTESNLKTLFTAQGSQADVITIAAANNQALVSLAAALQERRLKLSDAMSKFTKNSNELKAAKREWAAYQRVADATISQAKHSVADGSNSALLTAKAELEAAKQGSATADKILKAYEAESLTYPSQHLQFESAEAQFKAALEERTALDENLSTAQLLEARDPSRFVAVDKPEAQLRPIGPRHTLIAGLIFLATLILCCLPIARDVLFPSA